VSHAHRVPQHLIHSLQVADDPICKRWRRITNSHDEDRPLNGDSPLMRRLPHHWLVYMPALQKHRMKRIYPQSCYKYLVSMGKLEFVWHACLDCVCDNSSASLTLYLRPGWLSEEIVCFWARNIFMQVIRRRMPRERAVAQSK
jgi:hypothetical protein